MSTPATRVAAAPPPGYRFTFEPHAPRVRVVADGITLADSDRVMVMAETRLAPVLYFPREQVRMDLLEASGYQTHCPFKGNATHYSLRREERLVENLAWSYETPLAGAEAIAGYVAFYADRVDGTFEDESAQVTSIAAPGAGYANPLLGWVLHEAPHLASAESLTDALARAARVAGVPLMRLSVVLQTLHPQLVGVNFRWSSASGEIEVFEATEETRAGPMYLRSPLKPIFEGAGGIRRRLDIPDAVLDFGILEDLRAEGATDYVAMPLPFSDGTLHALTVTSDRPGGFSTEHLGYLYEVLGMIGRLYEVHALRRTAVTLLDTYLGPHAGEQVLSGRIRRGDGEDIRAVIWFCDLRDSTPLAQSMSRAEFLGLLNEFFDCLAGAVIAHGGQVLRFIGDAALAIFPVEDADCGWKASECLSAERAREQALAAAVEAAQRMDAANQRRTAKGWQPLRYGLALHEGEVTYGNIGTAERLEFTVIGEAANLAARVESMCKTLGEPALVSAEFARHFPGRFVSLGRHPLRGVAGEQEIFALRER